MLLDPIPDDCALAVVDVEANAEARAYGAAHNGGYIDQCAVGKREGDVNRLPDGERSDGFELHTTHGKVSTLGRDAVGAIVASNDYWNFK